MALGLYTPSPVCKTVYTILLRRLFYKGFIGPLQPYLAGIR